MICAKAREGGYVMANEYVLMNKDEQVLDFHCLRNEYDEPEFFETLWHVAYRPIGYRSLMSFLDHRKAPKHRKHIKNLLEQYGCDDLEGFIQVTHALSLNDTFWVKQAEDNIAWEDVSLYRNEFNELISAAAFDGTISETDLSSTSPEFGTDGYYAKCWAREENSIYLYKRGSPLYEIEPLSEFLASQIASELCPSHISYDLAFHHGALISKCELFTNEDVGLAKASAVFKGEECTIPVLLKYFSSIGSEDAFRRMCILDSVIYNPDRHYGNFGVLFNTNTMEIMGMAPVFDHNLSLFPSLDGDQLTNPAWYVKKCHPKLGRDFVLNARQLMTDDIRRDLIALKDFSFTQHPHIAAEQSRLDALSSLVREQIRLILDN